LFVLAKDHHLPFSKQLTKTNKHGVPWVSLLVEGIIACMLLVISKNLFALQNMTVFGVVSAYFFSSLAAFIAIKRKRSLHALLVVPIIAVFSSSYIIQLCLNNLRKSGISLSFLLIFAIGLSCAIWKMVHSKK